MQVKPSDEREAAAFYRLSQLYRSQDFGENATEVLQKLLLFDPAYPGAAADLAALSEEAKGSAMVFKKIVRDDAAFRGAGWRTRQQIWDYPTYRRSSRVSPGWVLAEPGSTLR